MHPIFEQVSKMGIVPVIKITDETKAVPLAQALCDGGLPCAEVTFRTAQAAAAIRAITEAMPDMLVGAGTVLTPAQVDEAIAAGASFIVAPGFNPQVVDYCQKKGVPVLPGCATPSEIEQALSMGLSVVKFFPAEAAGGLEMIKAMSAPYGDVRFVPTGGIGPANLKSYLAFNKVLACGGSWMVKEDLIAAGAFDKITQMTKEAIDLMLGFELASVEVPGTETGFDFAKLFGLSLFKTLESGKNSRITLTTTSLNRALFYLSQRGAEADLQNAHRENGKLLEASLKNSFFGCEIWIKEKN